MDWETSWRLLTTEINRSSQTDLDMAQIALINAMDYYKSFPFDFNQGFESVHLPAGQEMYSSNAVPAGYPATRAGMPYGLRRPTVIQIVAIVTSGDVDTGLGSFTYQATGGNPLKQVSIEEMAAFHQGIGDNRTTVGGWPQYWSWMGDGRIRLFPVPFTDMLASVYFTRDAHRPRYRWVAAVEGNWVFEQLKPSSEDLAFWQWGELSPDFTNVWLEHAEPMIRARARTELYMSMYGDAGAAQIASASMRDQESRLHYEFQTAMGGTNVRRSSSL